jgi:hypothetical protein
LAPVSSFLKETEILIACETAYVYCVGISTCFSDEHFSEGKPLAEMDDEQLWGWSIDVSNIFVGGDDAVLTCAIYVGVANACDIIPGVQVGTAFIMQDSLIFSLNPGSEARMLRVYAVPGEGGYTDKHLVRGLRGAHEEKKYSRTPGSHPLNVTLESITTIFPFTKDREMDYLSAFGYDVFSLGRGGKNFLSIQADVCTVGRTDTSS